MRGGWLFGRMASVYRAVAIACGHRAYLLLFLYARVVSRWHALIPSILFCCWRRLRASSPSSRLGPFVVDLCPVGCGGRVVGGFLCVCGRGLGGVSRIPSLPCSFHPLLGFRLLVNARAVLSLVAALFLFSIPGGVRPPPCFCARAFFSRFFLPSSPFKTFCPFAASLMCMCSVALHTLLCLRQLVCVCIVWAYLWIPVHVGCPCSPGYTSSVTMLLSVVLAASSCVSFTPPRSRCDLLWTCALWGAHCGEEIVSGGVGVISFAFVLKPVRTPVAILGSLGVCLYVPTSRHWLI